MTERILQKLKEKQEEEAKKKENVQRMKTESNRKPSGASSKKEIEEFKAKYIDGVSYSSNEIEEDSKDDNETPMEKLQKTTFPKYFEIC